MNRHWERWVASGLTMMAFLLGLWVLLTVAGTNVERRDHGGRVLAASNLLTPTLGSPVTPTQQTPTAMPSTAVRAALTVPPTMTMTPARGEAVVVVHVVDGDTIDVQHNGAVERVRYVGIDTPERGQPGYKAASAANTALVKGQTVYLVQDVSERDRSGRLLRYVFLQDGRWVNGEMVAQGWAQPVAYAPDTARHAELENLARAAAQAKRGFWSGTSPIDGAMSYGLTQQGIEMRQGPSVDFAVTRRLDAETPLTIFGRTTIGDWLQVRTPMRDGGW